VHVEQSADVLHVFAHVIPELDSSPVSTTLLPVSSTVPLPVSAGVDVEPVSTGPSPVSSSPVLESNPPDPEPPAS
jgi:hypothetical protein